MYYILLSVVKVEMVHQITIVDLLLVVKAAIMVVAMAVMDLAQNIEITITLHQVVVAVVLQVFLLLMEHLQNMI